MTADVDSGDAIINPSGYNISMVAVFWHGTGTLT
jgi:hypothetical protein